MRYLVSGVAAAAMMTGLASAQDGAANYKKSCASCHETGTDRAPSRESLREMAPERALAATETGPMISMATRYPAADRGAIAEYITGKSFSQTLVTTPPAKATCAPGTDGDFAAQIAGPRWNGWGDNTLNTRYQDAASAGLAPGDVSRLKVKWAFGFPG